MADWKEEMETKTLASENNHWYDRDGNPVYEVPRANGEGMRPTTLADARKLNLVPSVTLILGCASKPGLEAWKARQLLEAALTLPKLPDESLDDYAMRVIEDSKAQGRKAAEKGTDLHKAIEDYIWGKTNAFWDKHCEKLVEALLQYGIDIYKGKPEHSFASPLGYGGKIDWHNDEIVIDFKTKDWVADKKTFAWPEYGWQLAAYANGIWKLELDYGENRRLINVFIGINDCEVRIHEWSEQDRRNGWDCFNCLLRFWQLKNNL